MSAPRYSPEFKQEAIKQVTERGHSRSVSAAVLSAASGVLRDG